MLCPASFVLWLYLQSKQQGLKSGPAPTLDSVLPAHHPGALLQPGLDAAAAQRGWLELSALRARLAGVAGSWRAECGYLLRILSVRSLSLGDADDLEALLGCLEANGYFTRLAGLAGAR
jgi:hypothetical protein